MTEAQKRLKELRDEQSRSRQRMAEIALIDGELSPEIRSELDAIEKSTPDLERKIRAATNALETEEREAQINTLDNPDPEMRERLELRSRCRVTNFLTSAARGQVLKGPEAELQQLNNCDGIPLEVFEPSPAPEERAVTPSPSTTGVNLSPIQPAVFASSIAPMLEIDMPMVGTGSYGVGVITTNLTASAKAKGADTMATAGAITTQTTTPKRISGRLEISLEAVAEIGQANFESALRQNLQLVMSDALDTQVISGDGTAPALTGLLARLTTPTADSNVAVFDDFLAKFASGVDGIWASELSQIMVLCGVESYQLALKSFRDIASADLGSISAADYLKSHSAGFMTNGRMPDPASDLQPAILCKKGKMGLRKAVVPTWGSVNIDDIYTLAGKGQRAFTMSILVGDLLLIQKDAFAELSFKVS